MTRRVRPMVRNREELEFRNAWEFYLTRCEQFPSFFVRRCCQIYDADARGWIPFELWPEQGDILWQLHDSQLNVVLKARQLGLTWLVLSYVLWTMLFQPAASVLMFSRRLDESIHLLDDRLKGIFRHLPPKLIEQGGWKVMDDNATQWTLNNGSVARAFPTTAGDSYTGTLAFVDEADLVPNLNRLMRSVKPTIDAGGKMILLSRADKSQPMSEFKRIYLGAKRGESQWNPIFLPWYAHPKRDYAWYDEQRRDIQTRTGALDDLHEQYPETDTEALAPRTLDKRIAPQWLEQCFTPMTPLDLDAYEPPEIEEQNAWVQPWEQDAPADQFVPAISGLRIYAFPVKGREYVIGVDPAEGNPTSDASALQVVEMLTGAHVATLSGRLQPAVLAAYVSDVSRFYNHAPAMVERNNHGHAVLLWLRDNSAVFCQNGYDGKRGWLSTTKGKAVLYDTCADAFREQDVTLHDLDTYVELASIEGSTLLAPEGEHDDLADAFALALQGRAAPVPGITIIGDGKRDSEDEEMMW